MASNAERWDAWEQKTGKKRPAYIDGVGNVNWKFKGGGLRAPHQRRAAREAARAAAKKSPAPTMRPVAQVQARQFNQTPLAMPLSSIQQWRAPRMNFDAPQIQPFRKWR